jgi:lysophospholipase L1-like esterase
MKRAVEWMTIVLKVLVVGSAILLAYWVEIAWWALAVLLVVAAATSFARPDRDGHRGKSSRWALRAAWVGSAAFWFALFSAPGLKLTIDEYHTVIVWLVAATLLWPDARAPLRLDHGRRLLGMTWASLGALAWVASSYLQNVAGMFYAGLLVVVLLLIVWKRWIRLPGAAVLAANACILLVVLLPPANLLFKRHTPLPSEKYYSYEVAMKDPVGYVRWCGANDSEWRHLADDVIEVDRTTTPPYRLKAGSHGRYFQSGISINRLGFRGGEVRLKKGAAYRIVALGESTTFGCTLNSTDRPWPELLAQLIAERLKPGRPVEVINAGVPGYDLQINLGRLEKEILPLQPDMIISYHGFNGFPLIAPAPPRRYDGPARKERPLELLADCELRLKLLLYHPPNARQPADPPLTVSDPIKTECGRDYLRLIEFARTNGIRLVLATYSMAVNERSDPAVIRFYALRFPAIHWNIQANAIHSTIVREAAQDKSGVVFVDTHPFLDGEHDKFIDLLHFTQEGRQQLAETFFAGITETLKQDLGSSTTTVRTIH